MLPDEPLPLVLSDLTPFVEEQLRRCDLSLHLVGRNFGIVPDGSESSIVELQYEAPAQGLTGQLTRLVWLDGSAAIEDERQRALIGRLRNDLAVEEDQLPVLQHALMRMWEACRSGTGSEVLLDIDTYRTVGQFSSALDQHAEQAYEELDPTARRHARGEAALLQEPELSVALKWRADNRPNEA